MIRRLQMFMRVLNKRGKRARQTWIFSMTSRPSRNLIGSTMTCRHSTTFFLEESKTPNKNRPRKKLKSSITKSCISYSIQKLTHKTRKFTKCVTKQLTNCRLNCRSYSRQRLQIRCNLQQHHLKRIVNNQIYHFQAALLEPNSMACKRKNFLHCRYHH